MANYTFPNLPGGALQVGDTIRFNYTGNVQQMPSRPELRKIKIELWGASGGNSTYSAYPSGKGGYVRGDHTLSPNDILRVYVGGEGKWGTETNGVRFTGSGGWNGGGDRWSMGGTSGYGTAAGGGATDVRLNGTALANRIIVAGGGGGGHLSYSPRRGGHGGGLVGGWGGGNNGDNQVSGGTQSAGGESTGYVAGYGNLEDQKGKLGQGGHAQASYGGGGGGGYYGGSGGAHSGAGGGSSYYGGVNAGNQATTEGVNDGNGYAIITVLELAANPPTKPSSITVPTTAKVANTVNVSWASVPVPTQPNGVTLTSNTVYYEVDFFNGTSWVPVTSKTSALNVNYTIPAMADTNLAKFRVRAFVEAHGTRFYTNHGASTGYKESNTLTIYNNNKPTTPLAFSAPVASTRYRVGFGYTISWGASTDLDNDPITYQLDYFDGRAWQNIANGLQATNRSFIIPATTDTLNAQFRVRAYDGRDYSDYRMSDKFEVFNNTPPNTPRPFTSPLSDEMRIIDQQTAYTVAWGPADVEEGETAKYEVSFRGSSLDNWVVIQDINHPNSSKTSLQHILPNVQDSETAQYRVRAYDGFEYGGYTESNQFSVSGNKVTNTSGFNQELMNRMAINQEVRLSWQPAETTRGTQVVYDIEVFDGFTWHEIAYNVPTTSLVFRIPPMEDTPNAKLRIRSKTAFQFGGYVESAWTETAPFTIINFFIFESVDVPFLNDVQKKENADYLRQKVNDMRVVNDLPPLVYTDPVIIRYETAIKAVHFDEIEAGILECFDRNPRAKFANARTEQELRKVKEYSDQGELIQELPQRIDFICKALMNK